MYGIFNYIWVIFGVNVGKYTIHGASGNEHMTELSMVYLGNSSAQLLQCSPRGKKMGISLTNIGV